MNRTLIGWVVVHVIWTLERIKNPQIGRSHVRSRTTPVYASVSVGGAADSLLHSLSGEADSSHTPGTVITGHDRDEWAIRRRNDGSTPFA